MEKLEMTQGPERTESDLTTVAQGENPSYKAGQVSSVLDLDASGTEISSSSLAHKQTPDPYHPLRKEFDALMQKYDTVINEVIGKVKQHLGQEMSNWPEDDRKTTIDLLDQKENVLRFIMSHDGDVDLTVKHVIRVLKWRRDEGVNRVLRERHLIPQDYFDRGIAYYRNRDKMGRPIGLIFMRKYQKVGNDMENFKRYMHYVLEAGRNIVKSPVHQIVIIVDMTGFSMSQVEWTVGPLMHELMFQYYPESVAAFYVLNMSWIYSSLWSFVKSLLPASIIERVHFVNTNQLRDFIEIDQLLIEHGGTDGYSYSSQNCVSLMEPFVLEKDVRSNGRKLNRQGKKSSSALLSSEIKSLTNIEGNLDSKETFSDEKRMTMISATSLKRMGSHSSDEYFDAQYEIISQSKSSLIETNFETIAFTSPKVVANESGNFTSMLSSVRMNSIDSTKLELILERLKSANNILERLESEFETIISSNTGTEANQSRAKVSSAEIAKTANGSTRPWSKKTIFAYALLLVVIYLALKRLQKSSMLLSLIVYTFQTMKGFLNPATKTTIVSNKRQ